MLFGPKGVLAHLQNEPRQVGFAPPGAPQGISKRLERRKMAKQQRINEILEERLKLSRMMSRISLMSMIL